MGANDKGVTIMDCHFDAPGATRRDKTRFGPFANEKGCRAHKQCRTAVESATAYAKCAGQETAINIFNSL